MSCFMNTTCNSCGRTLTPSAVLLHLVCLSQFSFGTPNPLPVNYLHHVKPTQTCLMSDVTALIHVFFFLIKLEEEM